MLKITKKILVLLIFIFHFNTSLFAESPYFVDFKYILNQSDAGKKAQDFLKNKLEKGLKKLKDKEKNIQIEEKKIIEQKNLFQMRIIKKKYLN